MQNLVLIVAAYLIGAFPSAYICGRLFRKSDIRQLGSGNVGALNTAKSIGLAAGLITLVFDVVKGFLAVYLSSRYGSWQLLPIAAAFFVVLGHNYNLFLGFKGGKGLGCLVGAMFYISPPVVLYTIALIALIILILRDTNTAAGLGIFAMPFFLSLHKGDWSYLLFGAAIAVLVAIKHVHDFQAFREGRRKLI